MLENQITTNQVQQNGTNQRLDFIHGMFEAAASEYCVGSKFLTNKNNEKVVRELVLYIAGDKRFDGNLNKSIFLCGSKGMGKSIMLKAMNKLLHENDRYKTDNIVSLAGYYQQIGDVLFNDISNGYRKDGKLNHRMCNDLGREIDKSMYMGNNEDVGARYIFERYEVYQDHKAKTHFTSNMDGKQLLERYGDLNLDRLKEMCNLIFISGDSFRQ